MCMCARKSEAGERTPKKVQIHVIFPNGQIGGGESFIDCDKFCEWNLFLEISCITGSEYVPNVPIAMYFFTLHASKVKFVLFLGVRSTNPLPAASGLVKLIMCLCSPSLCYRTLPARAAWRHKGTEREQWSWSQSSSQHLQVFSKLCTFTHIAKIWLHTASVFYSNELLYGLVGAAK